MIGLFFGFAVVTLLRVMIGIEPFWHTGLGMTLGILLSAAGFIWGVGGFNPKMSAHPDDSAPVLTPDEVAEREGPLSVLGGTAWLMGFVALAIMVVGIALAYLPGLGLTVTTDANSSVKSIGTVPVTLFGTEFMVSQAVLLTAWIAFTVLSLALAGGVLMWVTTRLSGAVATAKAQEKSGTGLPRGVERALANGAGQLAERIAPKDDKDTTAVVAKE